MTLFTCEWTCSYNTYCLKHLSKENFFLVSRSSCSVIFVEDFILSSMGIFIGLLFRSCCLISFVFFYRNSMPTRTMKQHKDQWKSSGTRFWSLLLWVPFFMSLSLNSNLIGKLNTICPFFFFMVYTYFSDKI